MTWNDLGDMPRGHWLQYSSIKSACNPMFESVLNGFLPKRRLSFFSDWLIMERSQNWPDLRPWISTFRDIHFIDTGTDINCSKFQGDWACGAAMTSIQTFYEVTLFDVTWWPDLEWLRSEILQHMREKKLENGGATRVAPPFSDNLKKNRMRPLSSPTPIRVKVKGNCSPSENTYFLISFK